MLRQSIFGMVGKIPEVQYQYLKGTIILIENSLSLSNPSRPPSQKTLSKTGQLLFVILLIVSVFIKL